MTAAVDIPFADPTIDAAATEDAFMEAHASARWHRRQGTWHESEGSAYCGMMLTFMTDDTGSYGVASRIVCRQPSLVLRSRRPRWWRRG